jgi:hypothetical protein
MTAAVLTIGAKTLSIMAFSITLNKCDTLHNDSYDSLAILSVTNKSFMLSVVLLSVVAP